MQQTGKVKSPYPAPDKIPAWLEGLPLGNPEKATEELIGLLQHYNSLVMAPTQRRPLLESLAKVAHEMLKALQSRYRGSPFPLSERNHLRYALTNNLYAELAVGYKCIVNDMHLEKMNVENGELFIVAVEKATSYLSRQTLTAYSVYADDPERVWSDLHQLYQCAEQFEEHKIVKQHVKMQELVKVAKQSYRRIVLLSVANPYHLMQGEAQIIYSYLNKWSAETRIEPLNDDLANIGDLVIDLGSDKAPQFSYGMEDFEPKVARTMVMTELMEKFNASIEKFTRRQYKDGEKISFADRMRRDMLLRLKRVWVERLERKSVRRASEGKVRMAEGVSACHYFIDGQQEFFPEYDEIKFFKPEGIKVGLSLVPSDYEPWKQEIQEQHVTSGIHNTRVSDFNDKAMDIWHKVHSTKNSAKTARMTSINHFETFYWHMLNQSIDGIGLKRYKLSQAKVYAGSLVAFYLDTDKDKYFLGVIRWIKQDCEEKFDIGVKILPGTPHACAARGLAGAGEGSEYFRSLILETPYKNRAETTIILPAAIYDVGSTVVVNLRHDIHYIKLTEMLRTTSAFSHFAFELMDLPKEEKARIDELKKMS